MFKINYKTDWSKGNRSATAYHNFCLALKFDDKDGIQDTYRSAEASGLTKKEIDRIFKSAEKSRIAHDKPIKDAYVRHYKVSKKLLTGQSEATKNATKDLNAEFESLPSAKPDHPYIKRKQIKPLGIKQGSNIIYVPFFNHDNPHIIQSWQTIDSKGNKLYKKGHSVENAYFYHGQLKGRIYVCEGYATAISIFMLTSHMTVACGSKPTLNKTAKLLKKKYPKAQIIICLDNDGPKTPDIEIPKGIDSIKPLLPHGKEKYDYNDYYIDSPENAKTELLYLEPIMSAEKMDQNQKIEYLDKAKQIAKGILICLIGPSGCGKTTYLTSLAVELIVETGKCVRYFSNENNYHTVILNIVKQKTRSLFKEGLFENMTEDEALKYVLQRFHFIPTSKPITAVKDLKTSHNILRSERYALEILDPITDVVVKQNENEHVRERLKFLKAIAEETNTTIIYSLNRKKGLENVPLLEHGMGAATFGTMPRVVKYMEKITGTKQESIVFTAKSNYGDLDGGAVYSYVPGVDSEGNTTIGCLEFNSHTALSQKELLDTYVTSDEGSKKIVSRKDEIEEQLKNAYEIKDKWGLLELRAEVPGFQGKSDKTIQRHLGRCGYENIREDYRHVWVKEKEVQAQ